MNTINVSLNKTLMGLLKSSLPKRGYNNVSEYFRDLIRQDLHLVDSNQYPYDKKFLKELADEAQQDINKKRYKKVASLKELLA